MIDQLVIGDKASFDDFGASLANKHIGQPPKKKIKKTVPFSNITHDFSAIDGEVYWEDRELEYIFEMTAPTPERLEEMRSAFAGWVMKVMKQELHDPHIPDYHFLATFEDINFDDDEGLEKTTATVKFSAYPYKIANNATVFEVAVTGGAGVLLVQNNSDHRITPKIVADSNFEFVQNGKYYFVGGGETEDEAFKLDVGVNELPINTGDNVNISMSFYEEVF